MTTHNKPMTTYSCPGHHAITVTSPEVDSCTQAAQRFAERKARSIYGRRAQAACLRLNGYCPRGTFAEFNAFIGRPSGRNELTGHNIMFTVHIATT